MGNVRIQLCVHLLLCVCVRVCVLMRVCVRICACNNIYTKTTHYKNEENITIKNYYIIILPRVNNISSIIDS